MASPLFDGLHLKLARKVQDPVSAAVDDGKKLASALRTDYLNRANRFIQTVFMSLERDKLDKPLTQKYLNGLIKTGAIIASGQALPSDFSFDAAATSSPGSIPLVWLPQPEFAFSVTNSMNARNIYTINGGLIYGYVGGAIISGTNLGALIYVSSDQMTSSGNATDILINSIWHDVMIDIAATFYFEDRGEAEFAAMNSKRFDMVLGTIAGGQKGA